MEVELTRTQMCAAGVRDTGFCGLAVGGCRNLLTCLLSICVTWAKQNPLEVTSEISVE